MPDAIHAHERAPAGSLRLAACGKGLKQVIAVITFRDKEDAILSLNDAAAWIESKLGAVDGEVDVKTYTRAAHAAAEEKARVGDFAYEAERLLGHG